MRHVPLWSLPLVLVLGYVAGLFSAIQSQRTERPPLSNVEISGGMFTVAVDPDLSEAVVYSVRYPADAQPLEQWRNHHSRFTFRREASARRAHNAVAAVLQDELQRALRED